MSNSKGIILERLQNAYKSKAEQSAVPPVLDSASKAIKTKYGEIGPNDFEPDDVQRFDEKIYAALVKFERILKFFKNGINTREDFLRKFREYEVCYNETIRFLRRTVAEIETIQHKRQKKEEDKNISHLMLTAGGVVSTLLLPVCPPLFLTGLVVSSVGNAVVACGNAISLKEEIGILKQKVKKAETKIEEDNKKYSEMRKFTNSAELENAISSLMDAQVFQQLAQRVKEFNRKVKGAKDMTGNEFKNHYEDVLDDCMGLMAEDSRMIKEYGKELAPAVMTFVFVVCLFNDHNQIALDCPLKTNLSLNVSAGVLDLGVIAGAMMGFTQIFGWFGVCFNILFTLLSFKEAKKVPYAQLIQQINETADKIEERFSYIQKVYNETKKYKSEAEVADWKTLCIEGIPDEARELNIKWAVKAYLPIEAQQRIRTLKITTTSYLVMVPAMNSQKLLQQKEIKIKGKNCKISL